MELSGPFGRLIGALLRLFRRRRATHGGERDSGEPPIGAGVPVRPKRPAPTLNAAAEAEVPRDPETDSGS